MSGNKQLIVQTTFSNQNALWPTAKYFCGPQVENHYPTLCQIDAIRSSQKSESRYSLYRDKSKFNPNIFNDNIKDNWSDFFIQLPFLTNENFNEMFNMFVDQIMQVVNKHPL